MNYKQLLVIATVLLLVFVAGCGGNETKTDRPAASAPTGPTEERTITPAPAEPEAEEEEEAAPAQQNTAEITKLLAKHTKVKSMQYQYQDPKNYPYFYQYFVKGDKFAVKYSELDQNNPVGKIDSFYLDRSTKKAFAYCERASRTACPDPNQAFPLTYSTYVRETPLEWIEKVTYAERTSQEQIDGRNTIVIQTTVDGRETTMWIEDYYGLPLQIKWGDDLYRFQDLAANSVDDKDLEHKMITY